MGDCIAFDFDGVLFDTFEASYQSTLFALRGHLGRDFSRGEYSDAFWGLSWTAGCARIGVHPDMAGSLHEKKEAAFEKAPLVIDELALKFLLSCLPNVLIVTAGGDRGARSKYNILSKAIHSERGWNSPLPMRTQYPKTVPTFWKLLAIDMDVSTVVDDDRRVINAAEAAGLKTIHWQTHSRS